MAFVAQAEHAGGAGGAGNRRPTLRRARVPEPI